MNMDRRHPAKAHGGGGGYRYTQSSSSGSIENSGVIPSSGQMGLAVDAKQPVNGTAPPIYRH
ncbi:hypothetical protein GGI08_000319 [Coemansia sp. S2]|nr:hypothetical protein GGI08_000319 [Coemansia sp. S2]